MRRALLRLSLLAIAGSAIIWFATMQQSWAITLYQRDARFAMLHFWEGYVRVLYLRAEQDGYFRYRSDRPGAGRSKWSTPYLGDGPLVYHGTGPRSGGAEKIWFVGYEGVGGDVLTLLPQAKIARTDKLNGERLIPNSFSGSGASLVRCVGSRIPLWLFMLASGVIAAEAYTTMLRRRVRESRGQCTACGYSLEGNQSGTCAECGTAVAAATQEKRPVPHK